MDIKKLNYFIHVAELSSFTRASISLGIEQSTLSRQIRALEQELGVPLFHRDGRGVSITVAGETLLARSRRIMAELSMLTHDLAMLTEEPTGRLKLGIPPSIAELLAAPLLQAFVARFPRMSLEILEGPSGILYEWLSNDRLDAALLYLVPATRGLVADPLFDEDLLLVVHPQKANGLPQEVGFSDLLGLELALPSTNHGLRALVENAARKADVELRVAFDVNSVSTLKRMAREGQAAAILPESAIRTELAAGELSARRFRAPGLERTVILAIGAQVTRTDPLRELGVLVRRSVEKLAGEVGWRVGGSKAAN